MLLKYSLATGVYIYTQCVHTAGLFLVDSDVVNEVLRDNCAAWLVPATCVPLVGVAVSDHCVLAEPFELVSSNTHVA